MGKVILICGKICSGKTQYARQLRERENAVILSTDEVTYDLTDNAQGEGYNAFAKRVNGYLRKKAVEIVGTGCNVILDWGFWTGNDRKEITEYFHCADVEVQWHYMDISEENLRRNIRQRNQRILEGNGGWDFYVDEGLYNKVQAMFEVPDRNEMDIWHRVP